ncbi:MAG: hypothetical protein P4L84_19785 [Isosphaeraceae bacterium]|nr:hypothetical protein [Isosphaeraceae bacterium]
MEAEESRDRSTTVKACLALVALMGAGLLVIVATVADYGMSWDEPLHSRYAELVLGYFATGGTDTSCNRFVNLYYYEPTVDLAAALLYRDHLRWKTEVRHAVSAVLGLLTLPALFLLGRIQGDPWAGVLGGLALLLMPSFYGHAFVNAKDVPFACFFAWSMTALAAACARGSPGWPSALACGLAFGLAAAVRPGALPLLALQSVLAAGFVLVFRRGAGSAFAAAALGLKIIAAMALAWTIVVLPWPWAHQDPWLNPLRAVREAFAFTVPYEVLFEGRVYSSDALPRRYLLAFVTITTPLPALVLAGVGLGAGLRRIIREPRSAGARGSWVVLTWLVVPIATWTATRSNIYDGMRHFLFVLPALALCAGTGARALLRAAQAGRVRYALAVVVTGALLWPLRDIVQLHPYQMTYYNELVGGVRGASGRYETDYWVTSYREAMQWVNARARGRPTRVALAASEFALDCARRYRDRRVTVTMYTLDTGLTGRLPDDVDYYIATTRYGLDKNFPESPVVKTIGRQGAVFAVVKRR